MEDWARRVEAAIAYSELEKEEVAERLGMSASTLNRRLGGVGLSTAYERDAFLAHIGEVTGLPYEFFTIDFAALPELAGEHADREDYIQQVVLEVLRQVRGEPAATPPEGSGSARARLVALIADLERVLAEEEEADQDRRKAEPR